MFKRIFVLWTLLLVSASASAAGGEAIDFCGNGIDEDLDGVDRPCSTTTTAPNPTVARTLVVSNVGQNESIQVSTQSIVYPPNTMAVLRVTNASVFPVELSGCGLPPFQEVPRESEVSVHVDVPGDLWITSASGSHHVALTRSAPPPPVSVVELNAITNKGYATTITVWAEDGASCPGPFNWTRDLAECFGREYCRLNAHVAVDIRDTLESFDFLPHQCSSTGQDFRTYLTWNAKLNRVAIESVETFTNRLREITLEGTPDQMKGHVYLETLRDTLTVGFPRAAAERLPMCEVALSRHKCAHCGYALGNCRDGCTTQECRRACYRTYTSCMYACDPDWDGN